jgi:hypothetical protein
MSERMNPAVKAAWVAALRSGEYEQTTEALKDRRGHCCLGVLCDLYAKEAGIEKWSAETLSGNADGDFALKFDGGLPSIEVLIWAGYDWLKGVRIKGVRYPLYEHNDGGRTFAEIADAIEAQL